MRINNNKKSGSGFEKKFAEALSGKGYWVHIVRDSVYGQPFDIVAIKNNIASVFDCKVCSDSKFRYSRIEFNQHLAFKKMAKCNNKNCFLALWFRQRQGDKVYCVHYCKITKDMTYEEARDNANFVVELCDNQKCK